ncbi:MAG: hypothetical protein N2V77_07640 [Canidatus Methanoxibalbensis ujae]|nr:hypothetical protein [Candidatus Methanoxibalbensis ujae]MCW7078119.1 hypothetical protein [Candidatus Methanoxibalbensis ujae]
MRCEDGCGSVEDWRRHIQREMRLALAFKIIQEMDRMCERRAAKTGEFLEKLSLLKDYTESNKFTKQVEEFARFMKEERFEYLDEKYKMRMKNAQD